MYDGAAAQVKAMGLTARKSLRLEDASLVSLFDTQEDRWTQMAQDAYDYTAEFVKGAGEPVRRDDLIPVLVPVLEVTEALRTYLAEEKLRQNYWFTWFGELIVDRVWDDLDGEEEDEDDDEDDEEGEEDDE